MVHTPESHLEGRPSLPRVSGLGNPAHVEQIMLGLLAMVDQCTSCASATATAIADDPDRMLTLHYLMRAFSDEIDGVKMSEAPKNADLELALLSYEAREFMVWEGLRWLGYFIGHVNGWWDVFMHPSS